MSKSDITDDMSIWEYSLYNERERKKERINKLIQKYGFPVRERDLLEDDYIEYDLLKDDLEEMEKQNSVYQTLAHKTSLDDEDMEKKAEKGENLKKAPASYKIPKRQDSFGDKFAELIATSDIARDIVIGMQGALDSYINPVGLMAKGINYIKNGEFTTGLERIEPQNNLEKFIEFAAEMATDGGAAIKTGKAAIKAGKAAVTNYEAEAFAKAYRKVFQELVEKNPGKADEIMATFHKLFGKNIYLQRGAAAYTKDGELITQGKELLRATKGATNQNYGITKAIGTHHMSEEDIKALPKLLRNNKPVEITPSGKWVYQITNKDGRIRKVITALKEINGKLRRVIISDYWKDEIKTPIRKLLE